MSKKLSPVAPEADLQRSPARATIDDVARVAAVSKATVSRFLNDRSDLLTADISARVAAAIRALAYRPSPAAQGLKRGRSRLVGLVVADITNPYSVAVLRGAEQAFRAAGYMVLLFNAGNDGEREREAIAALADYQVEGFIVHAPSGGAAALDAAARRGRPVVLVDRRPDGEATPFDLVGLDNRGAVRLGVAHLLDAGYRQLLYITEPSSGVSSRQERVTAFEAEVATQPGAKGASIESSADGDPLALDAALCQLQRQARGRPCAVFSGNAVVTLRVAAAAARIGASFGSELGLLGFDDTDWAPLIGPGISTISQPTDDIGRCAATCLLERMQGATLSARQVLLPGTLIARNSTCITYVEKRKVAESR